jgi:hypothetical protein
MKYSIVYLTNRIDPLFQWTVDSLSHQIPPEERQDVQLVVVDKYANDTGRQGYFRTELERGLLGCELTHTAVKPNVWCGEDKLTFRDYFAASNYRNTGILLAKAPMIAFLDDLSVVCPGWWDHVKQAEAEQAVFLGTYDKHQSMCVRDGVLVYSDPDKIAADSRRSKLSPNNTKPFPCGGSWMFGCSFACPTEALLDVNGFDEDCDSMGSEDYITGMMMERKGWKFKFCPLMKTIESDLHHGFGEIAIRVIKPMNGTDASHVILNDVLIGNRTKSAFFNDAGDSLRDARAKVLSTGKLPACSIPEHDWRDGTELSSM